MCVLVGGGGGGGLPTVRTHAFVRSPMKRG